MLSRYGRFMFAPDTGADGGAGVGTNGADESGVEVDKTDYKALWEKAESEKAKLKKSFDATASEIAELKKANKAKLSEEEKRELELAEKEQHYQEMANQLNAMKVDTIFAKQGFDEKDYSDLSKKLVEVGGDKAFELAEQLVEFVKKSNKSAIANAKNGMIKDSAITPKASTTENNTPYAKLATENNNLSNKSNEIKNYYKRK